MQHTDASNLIPFEIPEILDIYFPSLSHIPDIEVFFDQSFFRAEPHLIYLDDDLSDLSSASLHPDAQKGFIQAETAYKGDKQAKYANIELSEARRSSVEQSVFYEAFMWRKFFDGPEAPNANRPGTSNHEYGFAIDVRLKNDAALIKKYLNQNGWVDDKPGETWHFEYRGSESFQKTKDYIKSDKVQKPADGFGNALYKALELRKWYNDNKAPFDRERAALETKERRLRDEQNALNQRRQSLLRWHARLRDQLSQLRADERELRSLQGRISRMRYDRCPNGKSYNECSHDNRKRAWRADRERLIREYDRRRQSYDRDRSAYEAERVEYSDEYDQLRSDLDQFREKKKELERERSALETKYKEFFEAIEKLEKWEIDRLELLSGVQSVVNRGP